MKVAKFLLIALIFPLCFSGYGQATIYDEDFTGQNGKGASGNGNDGTTTNLTGIDWTIDVGTTLETDDTTNQFEVVTNEAFSGEAFAGIDVDGSAFWFSPTIDVSSFNDVNLSIDLEIIGNGANSSGENLILYYTLNPSATSPTYTTIQTYDENNDALPPTLNENNIDVSGSNEFGIIIEINANGKDDGFSFDNIEVTGTGICSGEPTAQATDITFSDVTTSSIDVSWSGGTDGDEYILVARKGANVNFTPADGTDYAPDIADGDFTAAVNQTAGNKVVFSGSGTSATVDGLCDDTTYYFQVFHYCSNTSFDYLTTAGTNNDGSQNETTRLLNLPSTQDFDSSNDWSFTASPGTYNTNDDVWANVSDVSSISGNPENFWGVRDLDNDNGGGDFNHTLSFDAIDISNFTNVEISFDYHTVGFEPSDKLQYEIFYGNAGSEAGQGIVTLNDDTGGSWMTVTESIPDTANSAYIVLIGNQNGGGDYAGFDTISITGTSTATDDNSFISDVTTQPSGNIASTVDLYSNSVAVFEFKVTDSPSGDTYDTEISQFRLIPGPNNTANWQDVIQGIRIESSNSNSVLEASKSQFVSKTNDEIVLEITDNSDGEMTIASGTTVTFTIKVFLEESGIIDNEVLQFAMPTNSTGWLTPDTGSSLIECSFIGFNGNPFTIEVDGDGLDFLSDASDTNINEAMSTVEVANTDSNGNIDKDFNTDISISSNGTLDGDPVNATPVNGVATFSGLTHTALGTGLTLTASATANGVSDINSAAFDIINQPKLLISEVADPGDDPNARYVELYNTGNETIDFSTTNFYLHNATVDNSVQLTDSLPAKSYYIVANSSSTFNSTYGFDADLESQTIVVGNGNDAYYLSTGNTEASLFDIYGLISETQTSGVSWDYEDSKAIRHIPTVNLPNSTYTSTQWNVATANAIGMTPGVNEQDYIYTDDTDTWTTEGLGNDPDGVSASDKNILVKSGTATLSNTTSVNRIIVSAGATLIIEDLLTISGDFISEGTTIFRSTATKTAALDEVPTNTRVRGSGFQTERYVPATSRSFRYISLSVNTAPGTINDNWQEGATSATDNPNPGFGTHITGSTTGANGLDQTSTGNPSLFQWNVGTQAWVPKTSTNNSATDKLIAGDAYAMLIRGDRSASLNSNTAFGPATILRATGTIVTGDVEIGIDVGDLTSNQGDFSLVGNPYQAQVDLQKLLKQNNTDLSSQFAYIYDPHITVNGGYATIDLGDNVGDAVSATPDSETDANKYLQPNQAFFVETTVTNSSPSLTFTESIKSTETTNVGTFSNDNTTANQFITINLHDDDDQELKDGVRVKFSSNYSNQVNNADAPKLWNDLEWFSLVNDDNYIAIESRALPQQNDTINLYTGSYQSANYHFEINVHEMDYAEVQLYDAYQDSYTDLSSGQNNISFSVDASIPGSDAGDRFHLVFDQVTSDINDRPEATSLQVYPNPVTNNQLYISGLPILTGGSEVRLQLYNMLGQKVYQQLITRAKKDQEVNLPELSAGNYLLQLTSGEQKQNIHLLVK